jgi:hypothetical protein
MSAKKNRADRDLNRDGFKSYPEEIPIYPTHEEFPANGTLIPIVLLLLNRFVG